jgi:DNA-binding transcriptional MocR family regulator
MTIWKPAIAASGTKRYQAIVEALERDVASGVLRLGERLPTHRELAETLGVAVGTISRAYDEAKRRGVVRSGVGSGTFVKGHPLLEQRQLRRENDSVGKIDLSFNGPVIASVHSQALQESLRKLGECGAQTWLLEYHRPWLGHDRHRQAGAAWLRRFGLSFDARNVAIVCGAQHAAAVTLLSITTAGDIVVSDELTDPLTKLLTGALGLLLKGLPMDADGILPEAFEDACKQQRVKALICSPDHHSPTLCVMPEGRRRALAAIARQHGVWILENAVYRPFLEHAPPPLASFAPEACYYFTSFSKIMSPGLRIGFLAAPLGKADELVLGMGATNWMTPLVVAEIAADWIDAGTADRLAAWQRDELASRNELAAQALADFTFKALRTGLHLWVPLPPPWRAVTFAQEARARQVLVTPAEVFATGRISAPHAVRISLGGTASSRELLTEGLGVLVDLLNRKVESSFLSM